MGGCTIFAPRATRSAWSSSIPSWRPIARAVARYLDRRGRTVRADNMLEAQLAQRFDAMERNIDTVAVEMERLSEAQRFTSKLLEQRPAAVAVPVDTNR